MTAHAERLRSHLTAFFLSRFNDQYQRRFEVDQTEMTADPTASPVSATDGVARMEIRFARLFGADNDEALEGDLATLEDRLSELVPGGYILWTPPGGQVPTAEPAASDFALRFESAARAIEPGRRGDLMLPAMVYLSKVREDGAYVSVMGGLSPYWTNISEHVRGAFILDSTQVRRPPRDDAWLSALYERIGRSAAALARNETVAIETEQAWTLQRLPEGDGTVIVAGPPDVDPTDGVYVRRTLRRRVTEANTAAAGSGTAIRALLLAGTYDYMDREPVTAALRGFDPTTYANLDLIALAADGEMKFVLPPRR